MFLAVIFPLSLKAGVFAVFPMPLASSSECLSATQVAAAMPSLKKAGVGYSPIDKDAPSSRDLLEMCYRVYGEDGLFSPEEIEILRHNDQLMDPLSNLYLSYFKNGTPTSVMRLSASIKNGQIYSADSEKHPVELDSSLVPMFRDFPELIGKLGYDGPVVEIGRTASTADSPRLERTLLLLTKALELIPDKFTVLKPGAQTEVQNTLLLAHSITPVHTRLYRSLGMKVFAKIERDGITHTFLSSSKSDMYNAYVGNFTSLFEKDSSLSESASQFLSGIDELNQFTASNPVPKMQIAKLYAVGGKYSVAQEKMRELAQMLDNDPEVQEILFRYALYSLIEEQKAPAAKIAAVSTLVSEFDLAQSLMALAVTSQKMVGKKIVDQRYNKLGEELSLLSGDLKWMHKKFNGKEKIPAYDPKLDAQITRLHRELLRPESDGRNVRLTANFLQQETPSLIFYWRFSQIKALAAKASGDLELQKIFQTTADFVKQKNWYPQQERWLEVP